MQSEFDIKREICEIGRRIYQAGFVAANDGNISVRMDDGTFLCTPTGVSKGFLKPADIAVVDANGKQIGGSKPRTSEIMLHLEIFHELDWVNAVVHAHPPHATAFAVAGINVPSCILPEVEIFIGQVPLADYDTPGSKDFAETILPHLRNKANTILLANHGAVACDSTLEQAYFHMETLDMYCRILLLSKEIGSIRQLPDQKVRELLNIKQGMGIGDPRLEGGAGLCTLGGSDEFLRGFSQRAIPQHACDANGQGRGAGIAGLDSQAGQPQPLPNGAPAANISATVAGREITGGSSKTAQQRAAQDDIERMVQLITDRIIQGG